MYMSGSSFGGNSASYGLEQRLGSYAHASADTPVYFSAQNNNSPTYFNQQSGGNGTVRANTLYSIIDDVKQYIRRSYDSTAPQIHVTPEYAFAPDAFLKPNRAPQPFVGEAAEIEEEIKDAFFATLGVPFPTDIKVAVLNNRKFDRQMPERSVVGFSLNRRELGLVSDVVVRSGAKDHVLLTIGHEIGHVLTKTLSSKHNEEAKAFAFSRAWMNAIQENDIAGLRDAIVLDNPAHNGLHDVACAFVWRLIKAGREALDVHWDIVRGIEEVYYGSVDN